MTQTFLNPCLLSFQSDPPTDILVVATAATATTNVAAFTVSIHPTPQERQRQGRRPESAEKRRWLARMRLLASAPSISRPPSASGPLTSSSASCFPYPSTSSSLSSKSIGPDNSNHNNNSHRSLSFPTAAPGTGMAVSSPPSARLLPSSHGTNTGPGPGPMGGVGAGAGEDVPAPISVAVAPRPRSSSWSAAFLSAGVEKLARDDDEAILWLIYGDDSCSSNNSSSDGMTNGDSPNYRPPADDKDGSGSSYNNGSDTDHGATNHASGSGGRYLYVEYLDWMDPDGTILGTHNAAAAATTPTATASSNRSSSSSSTTIGGGGYPSSGCHSEKDTPLSSPLASSSSLSSRVRDLGGGEEASMASSSSSPETPQTAASCGSSGNGGSSSPQKDIGEIKVTTAAAAISNSLHSHSFRYSSTQPNNYNHLDPPYRFSPPLPTLTSFVCPLLHLTAVSSLPSSDWVLDLDPHPPPAPLRSPRSTHLSHP